MALFARPALGTSPVQQLNYGIVFKPTTQVHFATEYWVHTYEVKLPHVPSITTMILSFVGSLSKTLFGTATIDDVNLLAKHINALTYPNLSNVLKQHSSHLSSFMKLVDNRFKNALKGVKANHDALTTNPTYYYSQAKFCFARTKAHVYVSVKFPLSSLPKPFQMYKVISLPVPVNNTSSHSTQLLDIPPYFALSLDSRHFLRVITLAVASILLLLIYGRNLRTHNGLVLELTTGPECVFVPILALSLCPSYWDIPPPFTVEQLRISGLAPVLFKQRRGQERRGQERRGDLRPA
ncbi:uncharacterized protein [Haliotis cracherodii]|uniref:uncharacterized protein n=1 Tax=Haliotis cracherodii TaxID=6455 RepID=UPI0039E74E09